jgi:hypothetical protein
MALTGLREHGHEENPHAQAEVESGYSVEATPKGGMTRDRGESLPTLVGQSRSQSQRKCGRLTQG